VRSFFVLVPSLHPTGPVKGAVALANALADRRTVTLAPVKPGPGVEAPIDPAVTVLPLYESGGRRAGVGRLASALEAAGGRPSGGAAMVSYCLSADFTARRLRRHARWISSVRGNLPRNYRFDYGKAGGPLATLHLLSLRAADRVVAMTEPMAGQIARFTGRRPVVIGNFVDEAPLEPFRRSPDPAAPLTLAFLGSLSDRKQPLALVEAAARLAGQGVDLRVDMMGEGPLRPRIEAAAREAGLTDRVFLHGHLANPYPVLARAEALVLPSLSEGISRAVLEALQLGVPVVLRDVDGNRAVVSDGRNGRLFGDPADLPAAILAASGLRRTGDGGSLLPPTFRQAPCAQAFLELAEAE